MKFDLIVGYGCDNSKNIDQNRQMTSRVRDWNIPSIVSTIMYPCGRLTSYNMYLTLHPVNQNSHSKVWRKDGCIPAIMQQLLWSQEK